MACIPSMHPIACVDASHHPIHRMPRPHGYDDAQSLWWLALLAWVWLCVDLGLAPDRYIE